MVLQTAATLAEICADLDLPLIFKASYDKANRTARQQLSRPRLGQTPGLAILKKGEAPIWPADPDRRA